jgi:hypothetical protein
MVWPTTGPSLHAVTVGAVSRGVGKGGDMAGMEPCGTPPLILSNVDLVMWLVRFALWALMIRC